jgi:hypothetical protein
MSQPFLATAEAPVADATTAVQLDRRKLLAPGQPFCWYSAVHSRCQLVAKFFGRRCPSGEAG